MLCQTVVDRGLRVIDAGRAASSDAPRCDLVEEPLDQGAPRGTGRPAMPLAARVLVQPGLHAGGLLGDAGVGHQMHIAPRGQGLVDLLQEVQDLFGAVAGHAGADDHARHCDGKALPHMVHSIRLTFRRSNKLRLTPPEPDFTPGEKGFDDQDDDGFPYDLLGRKAVGKQLSDLIERINRLLKKDFEHAL